ncbi:MAG: response regulator [Candidatus Cloacimonetes bacterium]|nr:response regulator [Candidatus Cloacimonadota bacterium]
MSLKTKQVVSLIIVEDEAIIAQDISRISKNCGYKVLDIVNIGEHALLSAKKLKPDLVLMDIMLGNEMSGLKPQKTYTKFWIFR